MTVHSDGAIASGWLETARQRESHSTRYPDEWGWFKLFHTPCLANHRHPYVFLDESVEEMPYGHHQIGLFE